MPTTKQKKVAKQLRDNAGTLSEAMRQAGYSPATARNPQRVIQSKGFAEICEEAGLTDELILKALADDIKAKPKQRVQELTLAARIRGLEKTSSSPGTSTINILLQAFGLGNEGGDARETNQSIHSPHESEA